MYTAYVFFCFIALAQMGPVKDDVVTFPDSALDAVVRSAIGKPEGSILEEDLAGVFQIQGGSAGIVSIEGVEHCSKLKVLALPGNHISDIEPIESLTALFSLDLSGNAVEDITPLAGLVRLKLLYLQNNGIIDIGSLSQLPRLCYLQLDGNAIVDLAPLASNASLATGDFVSLRDNPLAYEACSSIAALTERGAFVVDDLDCESLPGEPHCPVSSLADIEGQAVASWLGEDWTTCDLDADGIPDSYEVALAADLLCRADNSTKSSLTSDFVGMNADLRAAYARNLSVLSTEPLYAASWSTVKELIVIYTLVGSSSCRSIREKLLLDNQYLPFVFNGMEMLSSSGDPDNDAMTNYAEYQTVKFQHGSASDYVSAALTPLDQNEGEGEGEGEGEAEGEGEGDGEGEGEGEGEQHGCLGGIIKVTMPPAPKNGGDTLALAGVLLAFACLTPRRASARN